MTNTIDRAKLWCIVSVESSATFTGHSEEAFRAIAYAIGDGALTFSLPHGARKVFNWNKVLWFKVETIEEGEAQLCSQKS